MSTGDPRDCGTTVYDPWQKFTYCVPVGGGQEQIVPNWPVLLGRIVTALEEIRDRLPEKGRDDGQA